MKRIVLFILIANISEQSFGQLSANTETAKINGIDMYYEVYGEGEPLLLLHGWTQSSSFWSEYIPTYAQHFKVYAIDLRGHGRTSPLTTDFSIKESAKDILELLDQLKIKKVNAIGLSFGGLTLLELASSNPNRIKAIILIGASHSYNAAENSDGSNAFSYDNLPNSFVEKLKKTHHHGEAQIKALFNPNIDYQISLPNEALNAFTFRTLIIHGDRDEMLGVEHAFVLYRNIPNSALWIVPNTGHIAIDGPNQKSFLTTSLQFLTLDYNKKTDANKK